MDLVADNGHFYLLMSVQYLSYFLCYIWACHMENMFYQLRELQNRRLQIVHRDDTFVKVFILILICILLFGYVIWRTCFIS